MSCLRGLRDGWSLRLDTPAASARPQLRAGVEVLDGGPELLLDVGDVHRDSVKSSIAAIAIPDQGFGLVGSALHLDDEAPGIGRTMGRVRGEGGNQEEFPLANDLFPAP